MDLGSVTFSPENLLESRKLPKLLLLPKDLKLAVILLVRDTFRIQHLKP